MRKLSFQSKVVRQQCYIESLCLTGRNRRAEGWVHLPHFAETTRRSQLRAEAFRHNSLGENRHQLDMGDGIVDTTPASLCFTSPVR